MFKEIEIELVMKELSVEEKANAYDNVRNKIAARFGSNVAQEIFSEYEESEDEKIRKELISFLQLPHPQFVGERKQEKWIAWLEKQGENKTIIEMKSPEESLGTSSLYEESKFHEGDWIIWDNKVICYIDSVYQGKETLMYTIVDTNGMIRSYSVKGFEKNARLWTIQDAKDGDVLAVNKDDVILIFRGIGNEEWNDVIDYYCRYDCYQKEFIVQKDLEFWGYIKDNQLKPATKEQRDTLMKAMTDAGWSFDFEKKELKKIHNALEECEIEHIEHGKYYYCIKDYYSGGNKRVSKGEVIQALRGMSMMALGAKANEYFIPVKRIVNVSPIWSEEDDVMVHDILGWLPGKSRPEYNQRRTDWLKSLKGRLQLKQEE